MKKESRTVLFDLTFLLIASLLALVNPIFGICAEQKRNSLNTYPSTPEGVVEAFVRVDFDGISHEAIGDIRKRLQYTTERICPGSDHDPISLKYKIIKIKEDDKEAKVKVIHEYLGWAALDLMEIERKTEEIVYHLRKEGGVWKIESPVGVHYVSVKTAIKVLEWGIKYYKEDTERVRKMKKNIEILKKYL